MYKFENTFLVSSPSFQISNREIERERGRERERERERAETVVSVRPRPRCAADLKPGWLPVAWIPRVARHVVGRSIERDRVEAAHFAGGWRERNTVIGMVVAGVDATRVHGY